MAAGNNETFKDQLEKLKSIAQKFEDAISPKIKNGQGALLHEYGAHNYYHLQQDVDGIIADIQKKNEQLKSITTSSPAMRAVNDKQFYTSLLNPMKDCLQRCTTKLYNSIQEITLKAAMRRLEVLSSEVGLQFDAGQTDNDCFISSDLFYVEVQLDSHGCAVDVKLQGHTGEPKSCSELAQILKKKDYDYFKKHLQGLIDLYNIKGNTIIRSKILSSLEALEMDVINMMSLDRGSNRGYHQIVNGPVGYVTPRVGGQLMKMTYYCSPMEMLDENGLEKLLTDGSVLPDELGSNVLLSVESGERKKLAMKTLVSGTEKGIHYSPFDGQNCEELPANYVLMFQKPLPVSIHVARMIHSVSQNNTQSNFTHCSEASLDDLIIKQHLDLSSTDSWTERDFPVEMPDSVHMFRILPVDHQDNAGLLFSRIPFSHPSRIPVLIKVLRCQAVYNALLVSCLGSNSKSHDKTKERHFFDVSAVDSTSISVTFIHPLDDSIGSVDFTITHDASIKCSLNVVPGSPVFCSSSYISKVVNRCISIPVTMRSIIRKSTSFKYTPGANSSKMKSPKDKPPQRPKLLIPSLSQIQAGIPIMSPQLSSPSLLLTLSGKSPSTPVFPFSLQDSASQRISPSRKRGTPGSEGSRSSSKLKLPKITIKRKPDGEGEYEIDKEKSNLDDLVPMLMQKSESNPMQLSFDYPQFSSAPSIPGPFSNEATVGQTDIDGLLDASSIMGGTLSQELGIPSTPFSQQLDVLGIAAPSASHVEAFDLDAYTSVGDQMDFDDFKPSAAIDPSALVSTPSAGSVFDIDSFMNTDSPKQDTGNLQ